MGTKEVQLLRQFKEEFGMFTYDKKRHDQAVEAWVTTLVLIVSSLAEKFGWEAVNEQLEKFWEQRAKQKVGADVAKFVDSGEPRNCITLGKILATKKAVVGEDEFLEITPQMLRITRRGCGDGIVLNELGVAGKIYWPCTKIWRKTYGTEVHPNMKFAALKAACEGDDYCEFLYELED